MLKPYACLALFCSLLLPSFAHADDSDVGCVTTESATILILSLAVILK